MKNEELLIRPMQKNDLARIAELERLCFRTPWSRHALAGELKNDVAIYRVIEYAGIVIAYAGMWVLFDEAHVTNVAVAPDYRRQGLGRLMMEKMMVTALEHGATRMTLEVREHNSPAQTLYASLGFECAGRRKGYYMDTGEDALILWNNDIAASLHHKVI